MSRRLQGLKLKGTWTHIDYDTGEPYEQPEELEVEDEGKLVILCSEDECVYILPEWVDPIVEFLQEWKNDREN